MEVWKPYENEYVHIVCMLTPQNKTSLSIYNITCHTYYLLIYLLTYLGHFTVTGIFRPE